MNRDDLRYVPSLAVAGLILIGAIMLLSVAQQLADILTVIFLGIVLGVALDPVPSYMERFRIPRALAVIAVYACVAALLALLIWYAVPQLTSETDALIERISSLEEEYTRFATGTGYPSWAELGQYAERAGSALGPTLTEHALATVNLLFYGMSILVIAVFYSTSQDSAHQLVCSLLSPRHRDVVDDVLSIVARRIRGFAVGQLVSMTIVGVVTYIGLLIMGIPFPLVLAAIAFVSEILPVVGPWLGFLPALAVAATEGFETMIAVSAFYLVLQQVESNVIMPLVQRHQTEMPALVVFVAIMVGGAYLGFLGALAALPATIILHALITTVLVPWRQRQIGSETAEDAQPSNDESRDSAETEAERPPTSTATPRGIVRGD